MSRLARASFAALWPPLIELRPIGPECSEVNSFLIISIGLLSIFMDLRYGFVSLTKLIALSLQ